MTIMYSFKITSVNRLILYIDEEDNRYENLITKINYYYEGINDDGIKAIYNSSIELNKPTSINYKVYETLTENDLIDWLDSLIPTSEIILMQSVIEKNIYDMTTKVSTLPWET